MSAFMVSNSHIDALVHVALYGPADPGGHWHGVYFGESPRNSERVCDANVNKLGEMLVQTNCDSLHARYPTHINPVPFYRFHQFLAARIPAVVALKAIRCYEYQSCEHEGWDTSGAKRFCDALTAAIVGVLPGYNAAPWGINTWADIKPAKPELADAPVREAARVIAESVLAAKRKRDEANLLQMPVSQRKLF